jgi:RES domain-containing protein
VTIAAWRIVKARRAASAFTGEGARIEGGRWNPPGTAMVYTAQSAALATLEMLVHLRAGATPAYVLIPCQFDGRLVERLDRRRLPADWRSYPAPPELQSIGDAWIKSQASAVLEVPSAIIASESNYLLNPRHPGFRTVRMGQPEPFPLDLRLLTPPAAGA